jgi:4-oxalocrotonate tautomerase
MPVVTIEWYAGRSPEQKKEIAEQVTAAISEVGGAPPEEVWIKFVDLPKSEWAIGGQMQA